LHPVVEYIRRWAAAQAECGISVSIHFSHEEITADGVLFVLSYGRILPRDFIESFQHVVVLHASDLPKGRGWSPYIWELLDGADRITLSAITAAEQVDEGDIWQKETIAISATDIYSDINNKLFNAEIRLIERVLEMIENGESPKPQSENAATYYPRRTPEDSRVNLESSLGEIFNLLRVADPERYPVFFEKDGVRFNLILEKVKNDS
jgi:methionyl-tRNA formyltransferase